MKYSTMQNITIDITPKEVAEMFCCMSDVDQVSFFNHISEYVKEAWVAPFCFQMNTVGQSPDLSKGGMQIMKEIGESIKP